MKLLICTDGSPAAEQSALLVSRLGLSGDVELTLLGVVDEHGDAAALDASFERMTKMLDGTQLNLKRLIRRGDSYEQILEEAVQHSYDLVIVGGGGQHHGLLHFKVGSTTSKLARKLHTHFLVARNVPNKVKKVLVCTGAEAPAVDTMRVGGQMLSGLAAEVSVLHVMSQISLKPGSIPEELVATAEIAIVKNTREGQHLQRAIQQLTQAGIPGPIVPRLRHGLVVDEVLAEVRQGRYDLMVVGAHYQPGQNRWLGILLDDVTDQLINQAPCSVLIV
jgi:nucleotide-binding universal stress UspA family protein